MNFNKPSVTNIQLLLLFIIFEVLVSEGWCWWQAWQSFPEV